jgi:hypothetical protein
MSCDMCEQVRTLCCRESLHNGYNYSAASMKQVSFYKS